MWTKLIEFEETIIFRGARIRVAVNPNHGEECYVDFMVFHNLCNSEDGFSLLRLSGYKSGHLGVTFPPESRPEKGHGVATAWLQKNWTKWIPVDGRPTEIWVDITKKKISMKMKSTYPPGGFQPKAAKNSA